MPKKAVAAYETGETNRHIGNTRSDPASRHIHSSPRMPLGDLGVFGNEFAFQRRPEAMPLSPSPACPLSRTRPEANRRNRARRSFHAARKARRRVAESATQSGSGRSARPISVQVLMAFSRSGLVGDLPFFPVVQSGALICRLWCVSLPYPQLDTNLMPKRDSTALPETGVSGATRVSNRSQRRDFGPADRRAARRGRHRHTGGRAPCPAC